MGFHIKSLKSWASAFKWIDLGWKVLKERGSGSRLFWFRTLGLKFFDVWTKARPK